ncbi:hypothetical protein [Aurantimonas sp. VKM B-3413]|uniref:hypothetical protein n=1 Tax=Aurantimonas sp. VKM B-3413 TaxID=2779401 RepID=UPI001E47904D|nr:hypothetical protein [Aurantimonas sp. VKM B-3413]MCB8835965.1 hypothetical protein [Aurantimonas sp. VKM B-3413]
MRPLLSPTSLIPAPAALVAAGRPASAAGATSSRRFSQVADADETCAIEGGAVRTLWGEGGLAAEALATIDFTPGPFAFVDPETGTLRSPLTAAPDAMGHVAVSVIVITAATLLGVAGGFLLSLFLL